MSITAKAIRRLFKKYAARKCTDEERDFFLDNACRVWAKANYDRAVADHIALGGGPGGTVEELADIVREMVEAGEVVIDFNREIDAFHFVPGILAQAKGTA